MEINNVTIAGGGVLGSQIAWQTAFMGFNVTVYDAFENGLENCRQLHKKYADLFITSRGANQEQINQTNLRLSYTTDLARAVKDADLISESIPEDPEIKKKFYEELCGLAPSKTIFTTNSSTTVPSEYAEETGRPEKFLALHFANLIWQHNIGEVMGHPGTDPEIFQRVVHFAEEIGMVPIPLLREQNGYVINSLLVPFLSAALDLLYNEVTDVESIDKTWMIGTGAPSGPCAIMDVIGMQTICNVDKLWGTKLGNSHLLDRADWIKHNFIDKGKLGINSGEGFYKYPHPKWQEPEFLK